MWGIELVDWFFPWIRLDWFGIHPRSVNGLMGILVSPLLHSSWSHLMANTPPFLMFGGLIAASGSQRFWTVTLGCALISGFGTWLVSPGWTITVGASGIIFGYFGFLLLRGFFERRFSSALISLAVGLFYGSILWQVFPSGRGISWSAHFFGLVGGIVMAYWLGRSRKSSLQSRL